MTVALFFGLEITGGVVGHLMSGETDIPSLGFIAGAILGMATGAILSLSIVKSLAPVEQEDEYPKPPDGDDYREKFDPTRFRDRPGEGTYQPKEEEGRYRADEESNRPEADGE